MKYTAIPGTFDATITNPDLSSSSKLAILTILENPKQPQINSVSPEKMAFGSNNQDLIINGSNFEQGALVSFSGSEIAITTETFINSSQLQVKITTTKLSGSLDGYRTISVYNPTGKSISRSDLFQLVSVPTINSINPTAIVVDKSTTKSVKNIKINGTGFIDGAVISFSNNTNGGLVVTNSNVSGSSEIIFDLNVLPSVNIGKHDVFVETVNGTGKGEGILSIASPVIVDSIYPAQIGQGQTSAELKISGSGFEPGVSVFIEDIDVSSTIYISANKITALVTTSATALQGLKDVKVVNPDGSTGIKYQLLEVTAPIPILRNVSVSSNLIDYEKNVGNPLLNGVTFYYELTLPAKSLELYLFKASAVTIGQEVRKLSFNDVPVGVNPAGYVFYWDGSIEYKKTDDSSTDYQKLNGDYKYLLRATDSSGNSKDIYSNDAITVDV